MANIGRGTYEPPGDDIHIFDASEDDEDVEGSRLPLLIVIALFVIAAFAGVVWLAYTQGVQRGRTDVPRTIAAEKGPAKFAATGDQGTTPFKGLKIYQQPAPAEEDADASGSSDASGGADQNEQAAATPETTLVTNPPAAPPGTEPAKTSPNPPAASAPVSTPALKPSVPSSPAETVPAPAPAVQSHVSAPPASSANGDYVLQIGSYKTRAEADAAWKTYQTKHSATLGGYAPDVKMVDLGEKGTWYRLRVGSFPDRAAAKALCDRLTAEGGACFPSK